MIAAKHMDPVMGIDIHIVNIPSPAGPIPTPLPHPFIGFVFDLFDYIPIVGATVIVNGMFAGGAGTEATNEPPGHIPMGGIFAKMPPDNEGEIFMGSQTVLADGQPFSSTGLPVLSCSDVGMPPPPRPDKPDDGPPGMMLPTSVVLSIPMGMPVLVGGPPTINMMAIAMKLGLGLFRRFRGSRVARSVTDWLNRRADNLLGEAGRLRNAVRRAICFVTGHPVDIATGKVFTDHSDFEFNGPISFTWERVWYSTSDYSGPLGYGWHHSYDISLTINEEKGQIELRLSDGRVTAAPLLKTGETFFERQERLTIGRDTTGYFFTDATTHLTFRFAATSDSRPSFFCLARIENTSGQAIRFHYGPQGRLEEIIDSGGRVFRILSDDAGRIRQIEAPLPDEERGNFTLVQYSYDEAGNLIAVTDALGHRFFYKYKEHLLVQETNRNGLSFYFEYDGEDENARCTRTWGDEGIYDHKLSYSEGITVVENSLGHKSTYHHNGALVTREIDPLGKETCYEYNTVFETLSETDPLGRRTEYAYDERGNRVLIRYPDSTEVYLTYVDDRLTEAIDQNGGRWQWSYDDKGLLVLRQDPLRQQTHYAYDERGHLSTILAPDGHPTRLAYDEQHNVVQLTTPDNATTRWKYDRLGRNRVSIDPKGNVQRRVFDLLGQVVRVDEPDGNHRHLEYDAEGNVTRARDRHHDVRFEYQGMRSLSARIENDTRVEFRYDTEMNLTGIVNEHGYLYYFDLDPNGKVELESGFDELKRYYQRDAAGQVVSVLRASGIETRYDYDKLGRVMAVRHSTGESETYRYRADGELIATANGHSELRFERDALGRVLAEWQDGHWVASEWGLNGLRSRLSSSYGADVAFTRNVMGDVEKIAAQAQERPWEAVFQRDLLGLELSRRLPGSSGRWQRDALGRPTQHQIRGAGGQLQRDREYVWDVNDRLKRFVDFGKDITRFEHDNFGNLASADYPDGSSLLRNPDAVGNLFRRADRKDRKYGPAGQLLEAEGSTYHYDAEGNLSRKVLPGGDTWHYEWNAAGMLARVLRPDGQAVQFTYDALGRRLSKTFGQTCTRWIWDGNVPLHEWQENRAPSFQRQVIPTEEPELIRISERDSSTKPFLDLGLSTPAFPPSLITWLFEAESFSPLAKLTHQGHFSIHTDHLGTPVAMYSESGEKTWAADLDVYGKPRSITGDLRSLPFRYPGQYEDEETGLYYNRFRYYDADTGEYVSQDPIGLDGNQNLYSYVSDLLIWVDYLGLQQGGGYGPTRAGNSGGEVNHIPSNSASQRGGSGVTRYGGPAHLMDTPDHRQTASWGSRSTAVSWRARQEELIRNGRYGKAMEMDLRDIRRRFGTKYVQGLREMVEYAMQRNFISSSEGRRLIRRYCTK